VAHGQRRPCPHRERERVLDLRGDAPAAAPLGAPELSRARLHGQALGPHRPARVEARRELEQPARGERARAFVGVQAEQRRAQRRQDVVGLVDRPGPALAGPFELPHGHGPAARADAVGRERVAAHELAVVLARLDGQQHGRVAAFVDLEARLALEGGDAHGGRAGGGPRRGARRAKGLGHRSGEPGVLDLDHVPDSAGVGVARQLERLLEERQRLAAEGAAEPAARVGARELDQRARRDGAVEVGGALERRIVEQQRFAAGGAPEVVLDAVEPELEGAAQAGEGVFRGFERRAAVAQDPGAAAIRWPQGIDRQRCHAAPAS
jgi:hypothetical protein